LLIISFFSGVILSEKGFISITIPNTEASRMNSAPFGNPVRYKNSEVRVLEVEKIEEIVAKEDGDRKGYYLVITLQIKNIGSPEDVSYYSTREFKVVGSKGKIYPLGDPLEVDRNLKFIGGNELFEGEFYVDMLKQVVYFAPWMLTTVTFFLGGNLNKEHFAIFL